MSVKIGVVNTFPEVYPDKEQALKVLEESAEVFGAWQEWAIWDAKTSTAENTYAASVHAYDTKNYLFEECADVIQAVCNLLAALGVEDFTEWMQVVEEKNRDRGRYGL